ncbi:FAD-dependent oxidoreductase [Psychrosphaera algicola]|uniref:FAD-dependent oxidoreductase n=1 Tax=Psychrosphaera algicola TaxID=3023714 RepID=UPI00351D33C8
MRGVRGEVVRVRAPEVTLTRPIRLMHPRYPLYIVPKSDDQYVIGATEIESEDNKAPSVRSTLELLSAAYSIHKGFAEAEVIEIQTGLRPTLLDNEPSIIIKSKHIQINGLYRHGYLLTPCLVDQTLRLLEEQGETIELFSRQQQINVDDHIQRLTT